MKNKTRRHLYSEPLADIFQDIAKRTKHRIIAGIGLRLFLGYCVGVGGASVIIIIAAKQQQRDKMRKIL